MTSLVSKHIPNKMCSKRELKYRSKPWINSRIKKMMKVRDRLLRKWRYSKSEHAFNLYKRFRNRVANEFKKSKKSYFENYFKQNKYTMKKLWHGIKSIISNNSSFSSISKIKDKNGTLTSNPSEVPNVFNDFLSLSPSKLLDQSQKLLNHRLNIFAIDIPFQCFFHLSLLLKSIEKT